MPTDDRRDVTLTAAGVDAALAETMAHDASGSTPGASGAPAAAPPAGFGRYQRGRELGKGGMGRVLEATDRQFNRVVALKELREPGDAGLRRRFVQEAVITGNLEHPGVPGVYERGVDEHGVPFYTMRRVQGRTLAAALAECRTLDQRLELLPALVRVAHTLGYAHERGVIHRDVKPDNVVVGAHGEAVLLDWGIARVRGISTAPAETVRDGVTAAAEQATVHGTVVGTLAYMAPEQAHGEHDQLDERADVFALGAILYHVLTGRAPYVGGSAAELLAEARSCTPRPVRELAPRAPASLVEIAGRAMARRPEQRFASAHELAQALEHFQSQAALGRERGAIGVFAYVLPGLVMLAALAGLPAGLAAVPSLREQGLGTSFALLTFTASLLASGTDWFTRGRHALAPLALGFALATFVAGVAQSFSGVSMVLRGIADSNLAADAVGYREAITHGMYEALGALYTGSALAAIAFIAWAVAARRASLARRATAT